MNGSILTSVKKLLGIAEDYTHFDQDIIIHINSVLMILNQIGVGPSEGFFITDETATWTDFVSGEELTTIGAIMTYVYIKVKLLFDPPQNSFTIESMNRQASELEWRINSAVEPCYKGGDF